MLMHIPRAKQDVQKAISELQGAAVIKPTAQQIYQVLEENFKDCPWPVPPSAILLHLPVQENKDAGLTSEAILRQVVGRDKRQRHCYDWSIRNVDVVPDATFFDDRTEARKKPHRHYAFQTNTTQVISENRWATFLNYWSARDLATATNLLSAQVYADLSPAERELLRVLRTFNDVLLLEADDPLHQYQIRLRSLHRMGMLNLSLPHQDARHLSSVEAQKRSLVARLRESKKREKRHQSTIAKMATTISSMVANVFNLRSRVDEAESRAAESESRAVEAEDKLARQQELLSHAQKQLAQFQLAHPDWKAEYSDLKDPLDQQDARDMFKELDRDVNIANQLKYDKSGALTVFWAEQRKQLSIPGNGKRWNQQVLRYCFFLWLSLGNSKFDKLRDVLILPSRRTLQLMKSKIPSGDGYRKEVFQQLGARHACVCESVFVCVYVYICECACVCMYVCMCVCELTCNMYIYYFFNFYYVSSSTCTHSSVLQYIYSMYSFINIKCIHHVFLNNL